MERESDFAAGRPVRNGPRWVLPAALATAVVTLVLTQRRRPGAGASGASRSEGGGDDVITLPDGTAPAPPAPTTDELMTSHKMLMSRVQNDLRSIDPAALELVAKLISMHGYPDLAREAVTWADCARNALAETNYFPRRCGPYPYTPGGNPQSPIAESRDVVSQHIADLRRRYVAWIANPLRERDVVDQDRLEDYLKVAGLTTETGALRGRRDQLYRLITDNAVQAAATASARGGLSAMLERAREIQVAGYPAESQRVLNAVEARRRELATRMYICTSPNGCIVHDRSTRAGATSFRVPAGAPLAMLSPGNPIIGSNAGPDDLVLVRFDPPAANAPSSGWLLARVVEPESSFI